MNFSHPCWVISRRRYSRGKKISIIDFSDRNPRVVRVDINKSNKRIAHGIDRVLRPFDLH